MRPPRSRDTAPPVARFMRRGTPKTAARLILPLTKPLLPVARFVISGIPKTDHPLLPTALLLFTLALLNFPAPLRAQSAPPRSEHEVKAAYIYNFARLIAWPEQLRLEPSRPFAIGVLGADELARELELLLAERIIRDDPVSIIRIRTPDDLADIRILVAGETDLARWRPALLALRDRPVLQIGANPDFARSPGHIGFYTEDQRLRFVINPAALRRAGLQASSRLLSLALILDADPVAASPSP